jgi:hypothetical protein
MKNVLQLCEKKMKHLVKMRIFVLRKNEIFCLQNIFDTFWKNCFLNLTSFVLVLKVKKTVKRKKSENFSSLNLEVKANWNTFYL